MQPNRSSCKLRAASRRRAKTSELGFTLIEIMAVVLIIGLLSTLVGLAIFPQIDKARVSTTRTQLSMLDAALEAYRMDNASFPTSDASASPNTAPRVWPTCIGPVGLAETYSTLTLSPLPRSDLP